MPGFGPERVTAVEYMAPLQDSGIERLDRVPQDGYWYVLACGCKVAHIDGRFLHKAAERQSAQEGK